MKTFLLQKLQLSAVIFLVLFMVVAPLNVHGQEEAPAVTISVREGNDFATRVLGDPWDMNAFTDIDQGLNYEGRYDLMRNYQVSNGIFSYTPGTNNGSEASFYPLWAGYGYEMLLGKVGALYPVETNKYKCLYARAKITYTTLPANDYFLVWWHRVGNDPAPGMAIKRTRFADSPFLNNKYRMYQLNLVTDLTTNPDYDVPWQTLASWPAIRIQPTLFSGQTSKYEFDWIRLTDCQPVNVSFNWVAVSGQMRLWASKGGQQQDIYLSDVMEGQTSFTWDVQGIEPGNYQIGIENTNGAMTWQNTHIQILPAPTVRFTFPTGVLGEDYASSFGNPWDMQNVDFTHNDCSRVSWVDGDAVVETDYPAILPTRCKGGIGEADSQIVMNRPAGAFDGGAYRYLSFRMYINGSQPNVPDGMIGRLIWINQSGSSSCFMISDGIPYRTGWNTYVIDMWNPLYGTPEATSPYIGSGCTKTQWKDSHSVIQVRFDPNENYTGVLFPNTVPRAVFVQKFAWMRLTKPEQETIGNVLRIGYVLNKNLTGSQINFYYTSDLGNPTQHPLQIYAPTGPAQTDASGTRMFVPLIFNPLPEYMESSQYVHWNTNGAAAGEYYVCAVANDGYNQTTFCSDAPVKLVY